MKDACRRLSRPNANLWLWVPAQGRDDGAKAKTHDRIPAARCARGIAKNSAPRKQGRRECRALAAPEASRAKNKKHGELVTTVTPVSPGIPRANGFN
ncbi:hypothetical protein, partial [Bradyrhizobium sp.]|uniref:hypothetical protein n=1 Tax=Bradyrhizobium sp. TaxID=376 RepID=UPI003C68037E